MIRRSQSLLRRPPLRLRITAWYILVLGLTAAVVGALFSVELDRSLFASVDVSLQAALGQATGTIEAEKTGPAFRSKDDVDVVVRNRGRANFAVRLLANTGKVADGDGAYLDGPDWPRPAEGFATVGGRGGSWRVLTEPILAKEEPVLGWIQVAEPINYITDAMSRLREDLLLAIPLMLILAGAGGVLLVHESLKPISTVIATAQSISSSDLSGRIAYSGPEDELTQLARTIDRMLDRLEEGFELERRFTADASHELRTPLTAIKGQIDVALSRDRTKEEYQEVLSSLRRESDRLIRLTNDLLLLSRIGLPRRPNPQSRINLPDLVMATVDQISPLAETKQIHISSASSAEIIEISGDFDQLIRLFLNLLDNAVKYTPYGGSIVVGVTGGTNGSPAVSISNSGPGFAAEDESRVFERFYRTNEDRSRDSGGSGLGLAIAREIVRAHGGTIRAQSSRGAMTTFTVEFPPSDSSGRG
ncbi:MAG TPA: ATP-binding protein [Spirochaetia bacterium]|nr:ATP-binding protein [Spirochaetia bacterium]